MVVHDCGKAQLHTRAYSFRMHLTNPSKSCSFICRRRHRHTCQITQPSAGGAGTADAVNRWLMGGLMLVFGGILAHI